MSEHTPGPWTVVPHHSLTDHATVSTPLHYVEFWARDGHELDYMRIEDARLISAAPDLLHACEAALNDRMYKDWPGVADLLIAAIAKAKNSAG